MAGQIKWNTKTTYDRTRDKNLSAKDKRMGWMRVPCITCNGTGTKRGKVCPLCEGDKEITVRK